MESTPRWLAVLAILSLTACSRMPSKELESAQAAVAAARAFEPYAPDACRKAQDALRSAGGEIEAQKSKTFPSYERSRQLLAETIRSAAEARNAGESRLRALGLCRPPLGHDVSVFEGSIQSFMPRPLQTLATAAAMDMSLALQRAHAGYGGGSFGPRFAANAKVIESRGKKSAGEIVSQEEIRALKLAQTALYVDAAAALQAAAKGSPSQALESAYRADQSAIEGLLKGQSEEYTMSAAQRDAVCRVLAAQANAKTGN